MPLLWIPDTCSNPPCIIETTGGQVDVLRYVRRCSEHHVGRRNPLDSDDKRFTETKRESRTLVRQRDREIHSVEFRPEIGQPHLSPRRAR